MTNWSDDELCLMGLAAIEGVGPASVARLRAFAQERGLSLCAAASSPPLVLEAQAGLAPAAATALAASEEPVRLGRAVLRQAERLGATVVLQGAGDYPDALARFLGMRAPQVLFALGDSSLLRHRAAAVVGSRRPSRQAAGAAGRMAAELSAAGLAIVSGGATGIDTAAHLAAVSPGGTVVVPALGLGPFLSGALGSAFSEGGWCALGVFPPAAPWRAAQALVRNRCIVALAEAVLAFEPRDTGGTWHSSLTALQMRKPLFVATASRHGAKGRGLKRLVRRGAVALDGARLPDAAAMDRLVADYRPSPLPDQAPLFDGADPVQ